MPCYDERSSATYVEDNVVEPLRKELDKTEAYLCAIMKVLEKNRLAIPTLMQIDSQEAGVQPDDIYRWWIQHSIKDAKRKEQE